MAYNGSGVFNRLYNWVTDAANAIDIEPVRMDAEDDGFATGLSNTITRDGQSTITANIPFNSKRITGLADPSGDQDAATKAYVLSQSALGADLAAIEALTSAPDLVLTSTGTNTWALVSATAGARAAWALTYAADKMVYWTAAGAAATTTVTVLARQFLDDGNTTSMRTTLGLGTVATLNTGVASGDIPLRGTDGVVPLVRPMMVYEDQKASGTDGGGNGGSSAWVTRTCDDLVGSSEIAGASNASSVFTLPAGTYRVQASCPFAACGLSQTRWRNTTDSTTVAMGTSGLANTANVGYFVSTIDRVFTIAGSKNFALQSFVSASQSDGAGRAASTGEVEVYARVVITRLA